MPLPDLIEPPTPQEVRAFRLERNLSHQAMAALFNMGSERRAAEMEITDPSNRRARQLSGPAALLFYAYRGDIDLDSRLRSALGLPIEGVTIDDAAVERIEDADLYEAVCDLTATIIKKDVGVNRARYLLRRGLRPFETTFEGAYLDMVADESIAAVETGEEHAQETET